MSVHKKFLTAALTVGLVPSAASASPSNTDNIPTGSAKNAAKQLPHSSLAAMQKTEEELDLLPYQLRSAIKSYEYISPQDRAQNLYVVLNALISLSNNAPREEHIKAMRHYVDYVLENDPQSLNTPIKNFGNRTPVFALLIAATSTVQPYTLDIIDQCAKAAPDCFSQNHPGSGVPLASFIRMLGTSNKSISPDALAIAKRIAKHTNTQRFKQELDTELSLAEINIQASDRNPIKQKLDLQHLAEIGAAIDARRKELEEKYKKVHTPEDQPEWFRAIPKKGHTPQKPQEPANKPQSHTKWLNTGDTKRGRA